MKKIIPILFVFFMGMNQIKATHIAGCEITYKYIGNQKYLFFIDIYRDCRGVAFSSSDFTYYYRFATSSNTNPQQFTPNTQPKLLSITEVSNICKYSAPLCSKVNTYGQGYGLERHRYIDTLDLSSSTVKGHISAGRCLFTPFVYINQTRSGQTATGMLINAELSLCNLSSTTLAYNNSGDYVSNPMNKLHCNVGNYMSYAVDDPDQDSISYMWVKGKTSGYNTFMSYSSPFTESLPIEPYCLPTTTVKCTAKPEDFTPKGIYLNQWTGDLVVTPIDCSGFYTLVIEARQYRKDSLGSYVYLGCTRRDLAVWTNINTYNFAPRISPNRNYKICAKRNLSFNFTLFDSTWSGYQSKPDTLGIQWSGIPKGAVLKETKKAVNHYEYEFNWNTTANDAQGHIYPMRVKVSDNRCSPPMVTYRTFSIFVDGGCCDTFKLDSISKSISGSHKIGDTVAIKTDSIKGYSKVNYQWQAKSVNVDYGNVKNAKPYRVKSSALNIDSIQFFHERMNYRLLAFTDICADTSNEISIQIEDTCFFVHIDTAIVNDTIFNHVFDTTFVTKWDTGYLTVHDTLTKIYFDTTFITKWDTGRFNVYDTIFIQRIDTLYILVEDTLHFTIPLSGSSPLVTSSIEVYPNPTSDKLYVKVSNFMDFLGYKLEVRDVSGKILEVSTINNPRIEFNVLEWGVSSGVYVLNVKDLKGKIIAVKKIAIDVK